MSAFLSKQCMAGKTTDGPQREQLMRQCCHLEGETAIEIRIGKGPRTVPEGYLVERPNQFSYSGGLHPLSLTPMALTNKPTPGSLSRLEPPMSVIGDASKALQKPRQVVPPSQTTTNQSPEIAGP
mmetsp:Transcript_40139/g.92240  ORF Transcript_40139/g.92240 Transcript_40139/m.92240 type:complete len:125 (-) Transcript_40139:32-406(-)